MADPHSRRLPALLVTSAAAVALTAAPALATEGPAAPAPPVPAALVLPNFAPMPAPVTHGLASRDPQRAARLAADPARSACAPPALPVGARPRQDRDPAPLEGPPHLHPRVHRPARRTSLSVRLPARLRPGRYRITVVAIDAEGDRSRPVRRTLVVRRRAR